MPVTIIAQQGHRASWEAVQKRVQEHRKLMENARSMSIRRIHTDIDRISKREVEYAKELFETFVPVRLSWDPESWARVQAMIPLRVEFLESNKGDVVPPTPIDKSKTDDEEAV